MSSSDLEHIEMLRKLNLEANSIHLSSSSEDGNKITVKKSNNFKPSNQSPLNKKLMKKSSHDDNSSSTSSDHEEHQNKIMQNMNKKPNNMNKKMNAKPSDASSSSNNSPLRNSSSNDDFLEQKGSKKSVKKIQNPPPKKLNLDDSSSSDEFVPIRAKKPTKNQSKQPSTQSNKPPILNKQVFVDDSSDDSDNYEVNIQPKNSSSRQQKTKPPPKSSFEYQNPLKSTSTSSSDNVNQGKPAVPPFKQEMFLIDSSDEDKLFVPIPKNPKMNSPPKQNLPSKHEKQPKIQNSQTKMTKKTMAPPPKLDSRRQITPQVSEDKFTISKLSRPPHLVDAQSALDYANDLLIASEKGMEEKKTRKSKIPRSNK
ncbi:hypothetical protein TRFO_05752 [Tritrichomonas foetus]|uniref:Uncharacterized protein n=1 Tax=Tritrichomonas foetus TaxID=1144522 RepID=A0A1J4K7I0_9EUKA|nr:hypothetical protein TRFO_05752 [Tritrichomonas foetus]|eukprot:OHT05654.1 hypothetical protein TRFO_05752 [Tritrichomonas foetus]